VTDHEHNFNTPINVFGEDGVKYTRENSCACGALEERKKPEPPKVTPSAADRK
jgi:hypothetical protein